MCIHTRSTQAHRNVERDTGDVQNLLLVNEEACQFKVNRQGPDAEGLSGRRGAGRGRERGEEGEGWGERGGVWEGEDGGERERGEKGGEGRKGKGDPCISPSMIRTQFSIS